MSQQAKSPDEAAGPHGKVISQYKVYWNRPESKRVLVLQFPNRPKEQPYNDVQEQKPLELRVKPVSGLIEVDVPLRIKNTFDKQKALDYGKALKKSKVLQQGGSYGLAGGFGMSSQGRIKREDQDFERMEDEEPSVRRFEEARASGSVMEKITLGGRMNLPKSGGPIYAIGVFEGDELHLTRVDAFGSLQPQFHHLDAQTDNEKSNARAQREAENPPPESEARAINMAVKSVDEEEQLDMSEVGKTLRAMQEESWKKLDWMDEDDPDAYRLYKSDLFLTSDRKDHDVLSSLSHRQYLDTVAPPRKVTTSHQSHSKDAGA